MELGEVIRVANNDLAAVLASIRHLQHRYLYPFLTKLGVSAGQPAVLHTLEEVPGVSQSELARRINVRPPTATRMVERMVNSGMIERVQDRQDRRSSRLFLTNTGLDVARRLGEVHETEHDDVYSVLSDDEQEHLVSLLERIARRYEELSGKSEKPKVDEERGAWDTNDNPGGGW